MRALARICTATTANGGAAAHVRGLPEHSGAWQCVVFVCVCTPIRPKGHGTGVSSAYFKEDKADIGVFLGQFGGFFGPFWWFFVVFEGAFG